MVGEVSKERGRVGYMKGKKCIKAVQIFKCVEIAYY